jgi:beta-glucosidase
LKPANWTSDGSLRNPVPAFVMLGLASPAVSGTSATAETNANLLVSVARDLAQGAVISHGATAMSQTAGLTANAEHDLLLGNPTRAIADLAQAWRTTQPH